MGGRKMRRRALKLTASGNGNNMQVAKRERLFNTYQELLQHRDEHGKKHWLDVSLAFVGGCLVLFAFAVVSRKMRNSSTAFTYRLLRPQE
jgi:hypothetical protein